LVEAVAVPTGENEAAVDLRRHPYAIVASPMCDLVQDFESRTTDGTGITIPKILFFEVVTAEVLRGSSKKINSTVWQGVKANRHERYQFLEAVPEALDASGKGLPELGIDFSRFFALPTEDVYAQLERSARRRCRMMPPYREHFADRLAFYFGRVGLPRNHISV
jgi:hypothetical protein